MFRSVPLLSTHAKYMGSVGGGGDKYTCMHADGQSPPLSSRPSAEWARQLNETKNEKPNTLTCIQDASAQPT